MTLSAATVRAFVAAHPAAVVAELTAVRGSSPREAGAFMLIAEDAQSDLPSVETARPLALSELAANAETARPLALSKLAASAETARPLALLGTIGGGALEYMVIDRARQVLRTGEAGDRLDIPLGPEIGQCCGGRVDVTLRRLDEGQAARLVRRLEAEAAARPHVFLFGAGHVGHALARALGPLPVKVHVVDTRPDELAGLPEGVEGLAVALPESVVRSAPAGSAYVVLTHDHALDFLICAEALQRGDAPYVGMVGSATKKARFRSWYLSQAYDARRLEKLVLPIGGKAFPHGLGDKRPEVIAALAAAEILVHIGRREVNERAPATEHSGADFGN